MVTTPWFDYEIPMSDAAEIGTRKVIAEHSTIGIVVTTDGTVTDLPREAYLEAEERTIRELKQLGKPFLVLLNTAEPDSPRAQAIREDMESRYGVGCLAVDCLALQEADITAILSRVLYEFPLQEIDLFLPSWVEALPADHAMKRELFGLICEKAQHIRRIAQVKAFDEDISACEMLESTDLTSVQLGTGVASLRLNVPHRLFFQTLSEETGIKVQDDGDLFRQLTELAEVKRLSLIHISEPTRP